MFEDISVQKHKLQTKNVEAVEVTYGSIIITLTVNEGQLITQDWIHSKLRTLFDDILQHYACEGERFNVLVESRQLYHVPIDENIHENCVPIIEHQKQQEFLKIKAMKLEEEMKMLKEGRQTAGSRDDGNTEDRELQSVSPIIVESYEGNVERVKTILSTKTVDIDMRGQLGRTAVMMAAQNGKTDMVKFLQEQGSDLTVLDDRENNILHVACLGGSQEMVNYILSLDIVDINSRGERGMTAVMMAGYAAYEPIFNLLLTKGCDLTGVDVNGDNIFHLASLGGSVNIVKSILSKTNIDVNERGEYGRTAVMKASGKGHTKLVKFLMSRGSDVSAVDDDGNNILHLACIDAGIDLVQEILKEGTVDIESKGIYGWTPLMIAAENGHYELFKFLVEKGCDISFEDSSSNNIFHIAAIGGNVDIVKYLLENHASHKEKANEFGKSPVDVAKSLQNDMIVKLVAAVA